MSNPAFVSFGKGIMQTSWMMWERVFEQWSQWRSAYTTQYGICKVVVRKHRGKTIHCKDGTGIEDGDWIGELHLDNRKVLQLLQCSGSERTALTTARMARDSLRQISEALQNNPDLSDVKALIGITLLHRGIVHGLGFERHRMESRWFERLSTVYLRILLRVMHPEGKLRIRQRTEQLVPMMLVHTRGSLHTCFPVPSTKTLASV